MSNSKIDNVFNLNAQERYGYLIRKVADFEQIFLISQNDGAPVELGIEENKCIPVWPESEFAASFLIDDWESYQVNVIEIDDFLEWLEEVKLEEYLIAVFPNRKLNAVIVDPLKIKEHINTERSQYE
jgi:hypothetical protein